jgi:hypothetical protein
LLTHRRLLELLPVRARLPAFPERCGPQDRRAFEHCEESSQCCGGRDRLTDYRSRRSPGRPSSSDTPAVPGLSPPRLPRWISPLPSRSSGRHSQQELLQAGMLRPISPLRRPRRLRLRLRGLVQRDKGKKRATSPSGKSASSRASSAQSAQSTGSSIPDQKSPGDGEGRGAEGEGEGENEGKRAPDAMILDRTGEAGMDGVIGLGQSRLVGFKGVIVEEDEGTKGICSVLVYK